MAKQTQNLSISDLGDMQVLAEDVAKFIKENKLSTNVQGKEFPQVEAWQYAGNRLNLIPQGVYIKNISTDSELKYEASVKIIDINSGKTVGRGFAICSNKEQGKKFYQEYAIASMAQTRATGKAFRLMLSFIMKLAGYEVTPAEEMDYAGNTPEVKVEQPKQSQQPPQQPAPANSIAPTPAGVTAPQQPEAVITPPAEGTVNNAVKYASAKQKEEIIRLLNNPVITRQEKTKMLLNVNKLDEERATQAIAKLRKVIEEREEQSANA